MTRQVSSCGPGTCQESVVCGECLIAEHQSSTSPGQCQANPECLERLILDNQHEKSTRTQPVLSSAVTHVSVR